MNPFSSMFRQLLASKDVTVNELSRATMIDHSTLYKVANGTRKPSGTDMVKRISDALRLSQREWLDLRDAYYLTVLGPSRFYGGRHITELLNHLGSWKGTSTASLGISIKNILADFPDHKTLTDADEIRHALFCTMTAAGAAKNSEIRLFTSTLTPDLEGMLHYVCVMLPDVKIKHLVVFDNARNVADDGRLYNLTTLSQMLTLIANYKNYHARCVYANISSLQSFSTMPGEILITDQACTIYSREADHAIFSKRPDVIAMWNEIFDHLAASSFDYFTYLSPHSFFAEIQNSYQPEHKKVQRYALNPGLCSVLLLDPETDIQQLAHLLRFPNSQTQEDFLSGIADYLPRQKAVLMNQDERLTLLSTRQGIEYFAKFGCLNEVSPSVLTPLSYADRLKYLKRWKALYEKDVFILLDFPALRRDARTCLYATPKDLHIQISADDGLFLTERVEEPGIAALFYWYCEFISKEYLMDRDTALSFFDRCIRDLSEKAAGSGPTGL
jgi:transcriptional regulator with XRE-family HTH domain